MNCNIIDLFSGVGGLSLGFEKEGFKTVLANEIDSDIAKSYSKNHPNTFLINTDITKLDIEQIFASYKNTDVVVGGPPCQGFSQKGKRNIMADSRNYLFRYFFDVIKFIKPKYFVMENVPNILTANNASFKNEIYQLFEEIGYTLNSEVLNAKDYGVAQNRRRAIIIGRLGSKIVSMPKKTNLHVSVWDAISDLNFLNSGEGEMCASYHLPIQNEYQKKLRASCDLLYNHKASSHSKLALNRIKLLKINGEKSDLPKEHQTKSIYSGTWSRLDKDKPCVTITTRFDTPSSGRFTHPVLHRALTVREAARIQSFPDNFIFYGSKTSQMKQVGNAVPPILAQAIAKQIKKDMENYE